MQQAAEADAALKAGRDLGPLHGIPYGAKDLLATKGIPTTWGCSYKDRTIDQDATVVRRLREAGAVLVAKLSMVEAGRRDGVSPGQCQLDRSGSEPVEAVAVERGHRRAGSAVAAGLVPFAIGTETWGSITTPSSYCGLTGLRPTYGRVSRRRGNGAEPDPRQDRSDGPQRPRLRPGPQCLAGPDPDATRPAGAVLISIPPPTCRAGPTGSPCSKRASSTVHPDVNANFARALEVFKTLGTIAEVELPDLPFGPVPTVLGCEMANSAFEEMVESGTVFKLTAPEDRIGGFAEQAMLATDYLRARRIRAKLCRCSTNWPAVRCHSQRPHLRRRSDRRRSLRLRVRSQVDGRPRERLRHARPRPPQRLDEVRPSHRPPGRRPGLLRKPLDRPGLHLPDGDGLASGPSGN